MNKHFYDILTYMYTETEPKNNRQIADDEAWEKRRDYLENNESNLEDHLSQSD